MDYSFTENKNIDGMFEFDGTFVCKLHPTSITVTDTAITFDYTVGEATVTRSYGLAKSGGMISSVTFPDGHVMEVVQG